jgi:uncharacterized OB-fold protein
VLSPMQITAACHIVSVSEVIKVTERLVHGQCRRCGAYAESPTYHCETCGTNNVDLFRTPVVLAGARNAETEGTTSIGFT